MIRSTLRPLLAATSAIVLSACAFAKPYEMSFQKPLGKVGSDRTSAKVCEEAFKDPGNSDSVMGCLQARGYDWDVRGHAIRQQAGLAGHLSFPAAAIAVGLTAIKDASDVVPILGLVGGSYLAHTGAYARPDQAQVYELAADSYRCLVAGAAEWKANGNAELIQAFENLESAKSELNSIYENSSKKDNITDRYLQAKILLDRVDGGNGLTLLRQSNAVETAARAAIGDRLPSAQAVAASVGFGAKIVAPEALQKTSPLAKDTMGLLQPKRFMPDLDKREHDAIDKFNRAESDFYSLLKAYQSKALGVAIDCRFNPSKTPPLTAPTEVILDASGKAGFVLKGGVPPYGYLPLPDKVKVALTPLTANSAYIAVDLNGSTGEGPWDVTIIDASQASDSRTISVKKPAIPK